MAIGSRRKRKKGEATENFEDRVVKQVTANLAKMSGGRSGGGSGAPGHSGAPGKSGGSTAASQNDPRRTGTGGSSHAASVVTQKATNSVTAQNSAPPATAKKQGESTEAFEDRIEKLFTESVPQRTNPNGAQGYAAASALPSMPLPWESADTYEERIYNTYVPPIYNGVVAQWEKNHPQMNRALEMIRQQGTEGYEQKVYDTYVPPIYNGVVSQREKNHMPFNSSYLPAIEAYESYQGPVAYKNYKMDKDLTAKEIIKKYTEVANDDTIEYGKKKRLLTQGTKALQAVVSGGSNISMPDWMKAIQKKFQSEFRGEATLEDVKKAGELITLLYANTGGGAAVLGGMDSLSFHLPQNEGFMAHNPSSNLPQAMRMAQEGHPIAFGVGEGVGETLKMAATATLLPGGPLSSSLAYGGIQGLNSLGGGESPGKALGKGARSAAAFYGASGLGALAGKAGDKLTAAAGAEGKLLPFIANRAAQGSAFGGALAGGDYLLAPEGEKPSKSDIVSGAVTGGLFGLLDGAVSGLSLSRANKETLNGMVRDLKSNYAEIGKSAATLEDKLSAAGNILEINDAMKTVLQESSYVGQRGLVEEIKKSIDIVSDSMRAFLNSAGAGRTGGLFVSGKSMPMPALSGGYGMSVLPEETGAVFYGGMRPYLSEAGKGGTIKRKEVYNNKSSGEVEILASDAVKAGLMQNEISPEAWEAINSLKDTEELLQTSDENALVHVFIGDWDKNGGARGLHYENFPGSRGSIIEGTRTEPDAWGVFQAKVSINGKKKRKKSTFFPSSYTEQQVIDALNEALKNKKYHGGNIYRGTAGNGLEIEFHMKGDKVGSFFPVYKGGKINE